MSLTQQKGLEITLNNIASCMDKARRALFELQKTANRGPNAPQQYAQFTEFRRYLRQHWDEVPKFSSDIHQSYKSAVLGCAFAKDAKTLCKGLLDINKQQNDDVTQASIKELYTPKAERERAKIQDDAFQKYVSALRRDVAKAEEQSKCTASKCSGNLKTINSVIENIQTAISKVQSKQEQAEANKAKAELFAERFHRRRRIRIFSPIFAIAESALRAKARIHNGQYAQCTEALRALEDVEIVISGVRNEIIIIEGYWDDMVETLQLIHDLVGNLRHDASLQGRLHGLIFDFELLEERYRAYKEELENLLRDNHST